MPSPGWRILTRPLAFDLIRAHHVIGQADASTGADLHFMLGNGRVIVYWAPGHGHSEDWWLLDV